MLLALAAILYVIGLGSIAAVLAVAVLALELTGRILVFTVPPDRATDFR